MRHFIIFISFIGILNSACDITKQYIENCNFSKKNFENYNFSNKTLKNINFSNANLFGAIFNKTKLIKVNFNSANLFGTFFVEASLNNVDFNKADISSSDFTGVKLNNTNFNTAIQEDTIFGKMLIEKDDVIKVKNCKIIIPIKEKRDWYLSMLTLSIGSGHSDKFIIGSLCKWHNGGNFILNKITDISKKKKKFMLTYNSCEFPIYVTLGRKTISIEDKYNKICKKSTKPISSDQNYNSFNRQLDFVSVNFNVTCGFYPCFGQNLNISSAGGSGHFVPSYSGAHDGAIYKGYKGRIAGRYNWHAEIKDGNKVHGCSGSFYISGTKRNYRISVYKDCRDAGSSEW